MIKKGPFSLWLETRLGEDHPIILRKDEHKVIDDLYHQTLQALDVGGAKCELKPLGYATTDLKNIISRGDNDTHNKGIVHVQGDLQQILTKLSQIPHFEEKAQDTKNWLQELSRPSSHVKPNATVGELLRSMFGNDALRQYGEGQWKSQNHVSEPHQPKDQVQPPNQATAPPAANQMQEPPPNMGQGMPPQQGMPGGDMGVPQGMSPPGGMPPPDMAGSMPQGMPPGGMSPDMAGGMPPPDMMGGAPPQGMPGGMSPDMANPQMPLKAPGGAFPKRPPGGMM